MSFTCRNFIASHIGFMQQELYSHLLKTIFLIVIAASSASSSLASSEITAKVAGGYGFYQPYFLAQNPYPNLSICTPYVDGKCESQSCPPNIVWGPAGFVCNTSTCPNGTLRLPGDHCGCSDGSASVTTNGSETCPGTPPDNQNQDCSSGNTNKPIITRNGNKFLEEADYRERAEFPLTLDRFYYYHAANHTASWTFSGIPTLTMQIDAGTLGVTPEANLVRHFLLYSSNGSVYQFYGNNVNGYMITVRDAGKTFSVWSVSGAQQGWLISERDGSAQYFNLGTISAGITTSRLVRVVQTNGLSHSFTYATNQVTETNDVTGNSIVWNYSAGNVTSAVVSGVGTFHYGYSDGMLHTVTDPASHVRTYWYEDGAFPQAITGLSDENGDRYKTFAYDSHGRAMYSGLGSATSGGPESDAVTYSAWPAWTSATVTNIGGEETTFTFDWLSGSYYTPPGASAYSVVGTGSSSKVKHVVGTPAPGGCLAANSDYTYDSFTTYRETETNSEGFVTYTHYDPQGRVITLTTGQTWSTAADPTLVPNAVSRQIQTNYYNNTTLPQHRRYYGYNYLEVWFLYLTEDFAYDSNNRITSRVVTDNLNSISRTWTYTNTYHSGTSVLQSVAIDGPLLGAGDTTTYNYNSSGQLTSVILPTVNGIAQTTYYSDYNALGLPETITDANGVVTTIGYNSVTGKITSSTVDNSVGGIAAETQYSYYPDGLLDTVTSPDGSTLQNSYNEAHQLISVKNNFGEHTDFTPSILDGQWTLAKTYKAAGTSSGDLTLQRERSFDALGRLWKLKDASGNEKTVFGYDANDNLINIIAEGDSSNANHVTYRTYDGLNRIVNEYRCTSTATPTPPLNCASGKLVTTVYGYDGHGNIASVDIKDASNTVINSTTYTYNGFGELVEQDSPDSGTTTYHYDPAGRLDYKTDANSVTTHYAYDNINRLTAKYFGSTAPMVACSQSSVSGTQNTLYVYDDSDHGDGIGRLTCVVGNSGIKTYSYDAMGRVTSNTFTPVNATFDGLVTRYEYNTAGALTKVTYPNRRVVYYNRNNSNSRLNTVDIVYNGSTNNGNSSVINGITYQAFGGVNGFIRNTEQGDTFYTSRVYSTDGLLTANNFDTSINNDGIDLNYGYDAFNNISTIGNSSIPGADQYFHYDGLQRLTQAIGPYGKYIYGYDAVGNRTSAELDRLTNASNPASYSKEFDEVYTYIIGTNRLNEVLRTDASNNTLHDRTFKYDSAGNRKGDRKRIYDPTKSPALQSDITIVPTYGNANRMDSVAPKDCANSTNTNNIACQ